MNTVIEPGPKSELKTQPELPEGWKWVKLGEAMDFTGGGTPSKNEPGYWGGVIPWASVKDIKGNYLFSTQDFITEKGLKNSSSSLADSGDVILITRILPGRTVISKIKTAINQDLKVVKPKFKTTSKFIHYYFKSIENELLKKSSGTTVLGITLNNLRELPFPLLELEDQNKIVAKIEELFSELDKSIESLKTAQQQLKIYRQAVLKWAFEGKLHTVGAIHESPLPESPLREGPLPIAAESPEPYGNQEMALQEKGNPDLPEGWKWVKLKDIGNWTGGGTPSKSNKNFWTDGNILWVSPKDVKSITIQDTIDKITSEAVQNSSAKLVPKGSILIVMRSGILRRTLPVAITDQVVTVNQDLQALTPKIDNLKYIYWCMQALNENIRRNCSKDGTTVESIESALLKNYQIPISPIPEQAEIVSAIESRLSVADNLEESIRQSLDKAEALRQSILKKAFEGKLV